MRKPASSRAGRLLRLLGGALDPRARAHAVKLVSSYNYTHVAPLRRIVIGDDVLLGPEVMMTAASYRYGDGHPVTEQAMDEADIVIGDDVWIGTRAVILPGARIGDGAIVGAHAVVRGAVPAMRIAVGNPARVVSARTLPDGGA